MAEDAMQFFSTISSWYDITVPVIHWRPVHNLTPCRGTHVQAAALAGSALARSVRVREQEMTTGHTHASVGAGAGLGAGGPIRPTRRHTAISPHGGLYAMPSLCGSA
jgi:hypothetical protein